MKNKEVTGVEGVEKLDEEQLEQVAGGAFLTGSLSAGSINTSILSAKAVFAISPATISKVAMLEQCCIR